MQTKNILCKIGSKLYSILKNHKGQWVVLDSQGTTLGMVRIGSWHAWIEGTYQNKPQPMQLLTFVIRGDEIKSYHHPLFGEIKICESAMK